MQKLVIGALFISCLLASGAQAQSSTSSPCSGMSLGAMGSLNGFTPSPDDAWHQNIANSPVDSNSTNIINGLSASHLHHDFSNAGSYGIPYNVVDSSSTGSVPWAATLYIGDSDVALTPIPSAPLIEGSPAACTPPTSDNHMIIIDRNLCVAYEFWQADYCGTTTPAWTASNGNMWDLTKTEQRPYGMTSADAAGLSIFSGLVRYDEVATGVINHAIRFTEPFTRCDHYEDGDGVSAFVPPATHGACNNGGTLNIMGMRIRLKASFDISGYSPANQVILTAMKNYGMILADNGSGLFFQGTPDPRWDDNDLQNLDVIPNTAFEVIQIPPVETVETVPTVAIPVINSFTASETTITTGQSVTLTPTVTGASYSFIDNVGFIRGPVTVSPTATTTYTLTSRNAGGSASAAVTVIVNAAPAPPAPAPPAPTPPVPTPPAPTPAPKSAAATMTLTASPGTMVVTGTPLTLIVTLSGSEGLPTGKVTLTSNNFKRVLQIDSDGVSKYTYDKTIIPGTYEATVTYSGDKTYAKQAQSIKITITPKTFTPYVGTASVKVTASPGTTVKQGTPLALTTTVSGNNGTPTGYVDITFDGQTLLKKLDANGVNVYTLPKSTLSGTYELGITYKGDKNYPAASTTQQVVITPQVSIITPKDGTVTSLAK